MLPLLIIIDTKILQIIFAAIKHCDLPSDFENNTVL